jgi:hypothetical protein
MRLTKLILGTLVLAVTLQPLLGQTAKTEVSTADSSKAKKFDLARASGFDFAQGPVNPNSIDSWQITPPTRLQATQPNTDLCYRMRVYSFTQQDDEAPRMTGSTTCTPANRAAPKSVQGNEPTTKARYVPQ